MSCTAATPARCHAWFSHFIFSRFYGAMSLAPPPLRVDFVFADAATYASQRRCRRLRAAGL